MTNPIYLDKYSNKYKRKRIKLRKILTTQEKKFYNKLPRKLESEKNTSFNGKVGTQKGWDKLGGRRFRRLRRRNRVRRGCIALPSFRHFSVTSKIQILEQTIREYSACSSLSPSNYGWIPYPLNLHGLESLHLVPSVRRIQSRCLREHAPHSLASASTTPAVDGRVAGPYVARMDPHPTRVSRTGSWGPILSSLLRLYQSLVYFLLFVLIVRCCYPVSLQTVLVLQVVYLSGTTPLLVLSMRHLPSRISPAFLFRMLLLQHLDELTLYYTILGLYPTN